VPATAGEAEIADVLACHPEFPGTGVARLIIVPGKIVNVVLQLAGADSAVPQERAVARSARE